jgi:hypothetical protein
LPRILNSIIIVQVLGIPFALCFAYLVSNSLPCSAMVKNAWRYTYISRTAMCCNAYVNTSRSLYYTVFSNNCNHMSACKSKFWRVYNFGACSIPSTHLKIPTSPRIKTDWYSFQFGYYVSLITSGAESSIEV